MHPVPPAHLSRLAQLPPRTAHRRTLFNPLQPSACIQLGTGATLLSIKHPTRVVINMSKTQVFSGGLMLTIPLQFPNGIHSIGLAVYNLPQCSILLTPSIVLPRCENVCSREALDPMLACMTLCPGGECVTIQWTTLAGCRCGGDTLGERLQLEHISA